MKNETYEIIWNAVYSYANQFILKSGNTFFFNNRAKSDLLSEYNDLKSAFKKKYMKNADESILDRHKVAAVFMIAILNVKPIRIPDEVQLQRKSEDVYSTSFSKFFGNEKLAIRAGIAVLNSYIEKDSKEKKEVPLPKIVRHGEYIENFCRELYINQLEKKLSILSIAHELFLIEELAHKPV